MHRRKMCPSKGRSESPLLAVTQPRQPHNAATRAAASRCVADSFTSIVIHVSAHVCVASISCRSAFNPRPSGSTLPPVARGWMLASHGPVTTTTAESAPGIRWWKGRLSQIRGCCPLVAKGGYVNRGHKVSPLYFINELKCQQDIFLM